MAKSRKRPGTTSFLMRPKISVKFQRTGPESGSFPAGAFERQIEVGMLKRRFLANISLYVTNHLNETVQNTEKTNHAPSKMVCHP